VKKVFIAGLLALATAALLVTPAGAAVPNKQAKESVACPDGPGTARLWYTRTKKGLTKLAVDNPCAQYVTIWNSDNAYAGGDPRDRWIVAPGAHFNWGKGRIKKYNAPANVALNPYGFDTWECGGPTTVTVVVKYDVVRPAVDEYGDSC
jgi:hypothetical protein